MPSISDIIPDVSDILPEFPSVSDFISTGITNLITAVPKGISEGITGIVQEYPKTTGVITGLTIGATIGSIVPVAGTVVGAIVGGTTGLIATAIPELLINLQNWFKGLGGYRGLGSQAIGKTVETITTVSGGGGISQAGETITKAISTVSGGGGKTMQYIKDIGYMPTWWKPTGTEITTRFGGMTLIPGY